MFLYCSQKFLHDITYTTVYITKAAWNCCLLLLWILRYWVTQTSQGGCYLFVFLLYNRLNTGAQFEGDLGEILALGAENSPYIGLREKWESP